MTSKNNKSGHLTDTEWDEMKALKEAINESPHAVAPEKMEDFTAYLIRSLKQRGG